MGDSCFVLLPQIRSVIRRSRETGHVHPMSREPSPRRRLDPASLSRNPSQEQLIAELQGRLGIQLAAEEVAGTPEQDWLTEGVVITVQPRGRQAGGQLVEKVASQPMWSGEWGSGGSLSPSEKDFGAVGWFLHCIALRQGWPHHPLHPLLAAEFLPSCLFPLSPS